MCQKMYEHGGEEWNSRDPRSGKKGNDIEIEMFLDRCTNLKLFINTYPDKEPTRESIEEELRDTLRNLNIDLEEIEKLETKQTSGIRLSQIEQQTLDLAKKDQLEMQQKIQWLNQVLTEYDSLEDFKNQK